MTRFRRSDRNEFSSFNQLTELLGQPPVKDIVEFFEFPPEYMTTKAVEAFVHGTDSLLYLWNQDEASNLVRSVYHPRSDSQPVYASKFFAISAAGSYCGAEPRSMLAREKFLHFFLNMLSSSLDVSELRHMRLFACLAIRCFANNVGSAKRLMCASLMLFELSTIV